MTLLEYYHKQCKAALITEDRQQIQVINQLQEIRQNLIQAHHRRSSWRATFSKVPLVKGLYLWGGVGIGKTFLLDCFYHCIPFKEKKRVHFHSFMRAIHRALKKNQGKRDPLKVVAKETAATCQILCFDEFFVQDIVDAMLLGNLINALFAEGVCLVATSNIAPDELYKNGLQRPLFLPTIELIKSQMTVMHIPTVVDYRLRTLTNAGVFFQSTQLDAHEKMLSVFQQLTQAVPISDSPLMIENRWIQPEKYTDGIVWFKFNRLCAVPRSQQDYLALVEQFHTFFIEDISPIPALDLDTINLLIRLIDVLYDHQIRLVFSASCSVMQIYQSGPMRNAFLRTASRLIEMQSANYFSRTYF